MVLTELECLAVRISAETNHDEAHLALLNNSIQAVDAATNNNDLSAWAAADEHYHKQLVLLSDNTPILSIVKTLHDQIRRARTIILKLNPFAIESKIHHRHVYNTRRMGDPTKADQAHRAHRQAYRDALINTLQQSGLKRI